MGNKVNSRRFQELDGLRGIAAVAVVISHFAGGYDSKFPDEVAAPWSMSWGAYGVQLFFLISGFVILMTARRARVAREFVVSRLSRLYPPYWLALAMTTVLVVGFAVPVGSGEPSLVMFLANLTMIQRWLLIPNMDEVYWTLAVEMQFYVVVFALLVLTRSRLTNRVVAWAAAVWCFISLATSVWAYPLSHGMAPHSAPLIAKLVLNMTVTPYGALFCAGMLAYLARTEDRRWFIPAAGAGLVAAASYWLTQSPRHGVVVLGIVIVFLAIVAVPRVPVLTTRPMLFFGRISYSLYICHYAVGIAIIHSLRPMLGRPLATIVAFFAVLAWSWIVYEVAEKRASNRLRGELRRWFRVPTVPRKLVEQSPEPEQRLDGTRA